MQLKTLPEQPGERRISVHWFFLPTGLVYLIGGLACLLAYPHARDPWTLMYGGWACIFLGLFVWLTFVLAERRIRQGGKIEGLFTIRVRPLILGGSIVGWMILFFTISRFLPAEIACLLPFIWVLGGGFVWNGIVRYFENHPPKR